MNVDNYILYAITELFPIKKDYFKEKVLNIDFMCNAENIMDMLERKDSFKIVYNKYNNWKIEYVSKYTYNCEKQYEYYYFKNNILLHVKSIYCVDVYILNSFERILFESKKFSFYEFGMEYSSIPPYENYWGCYTFNPNYADICDNMSKYKYDDLYFNYGDDYGCDDIVPESVVELYKNAKYKMQYNTYFDENDELI